MSDLGDDQTRGWLKGQIQQTYLPRLRDGENLFALLFEAEAAFQAQGFDIPTDLDFPDLFIEVVEECGRQQTDNVISLPNQEKDNDE